MCAATSATPTCTSAGTIITAAMMYDAVTGTASPSTQTASAAYRIVSSRLLPASVTISPATLRPSPVNVMTPTMIPAVAVVAATDNTPRPPAASAGASRVVPSAVSRWAKLSATPSTVAQTTARYGVKPMTISTTIAAIDAKKCQP